MYCKFSTYYTVQNLLVSDNKGIRVYTNVPSVMEYTDIKININISTMYNDYDISIAYTYDVIFLISNHDLLRSNKLCKQHHCNSKAAAIVNSRLSASSLYFFCLQ